MDSYYTSSINGQTSYHNGRNWTHETDDYVLRYWLGTQPENTAPASIKMELETKNPIVINWDESLYFYADGSSSTVTHESVPYGYRPANTELESGVQHSDRIVPHTNLIYSGGSVTNAYYLVPRDAFGTGTIGLDLVINGQTLNIRFDGTRD